MTNSRLRLSAVAVAAALVGAGAPAAYAALDQGQPAAQQAPGRPFVETSLLFGTARPDGGPAVTDKQFRAFVDEVVTPRFPAGLTVQEGSGQFRDSTGTIERERSYELILLYPTGEAAADSPKIQQIRTQYMKRFHQESVARIDDRARVDF